MVTDSTSQTDDTTVFLRAARSGNLEKVIKYLDADLDINIANSNGLNALHLASKDGHVEIVTELLKRGAKVDAATKKGNTALHIASLAGQVDVVNILIQYGAAVNTQSQNGFTPLYMAAQENHDQVVKLLLSNGANQSLATEDGFTPLAVAMQQGHDKVVSVLLENDLKGKVRLPALHIAAKKDDCKAADLLLQNDHKPDVTSKSGFTPLHIAAHYGNEEIGRLLIKKGADVNYVAKHNISPLHVAAKWGKNNMVKLLLENSAMIDAKTRDGLTPLHCAARSGHEEVVSTLLEHSAPISARTKNGLAPLHMASQGDHVDAARVLLYHRAPVDEVTIDYLTSLHVAAHCGHVRVAKLLLDRKADPNARALNGFTPLHIACKKNRIKIVELLLKHGASIESTTESGLTPLHVASFMGCMNIVIFLLQHEANPDVPTVRGETPLHLAARANQTDIIRILLRNGAKVDARAREDQTPLHIAARLGNVDIVMLLLQHGAAVDITTKDMYTALHIAAKEGQEEVAAILVENHASVKATTKNGFTPLHIAAKYGNMNVAKILLQKDSDIDAQGKNDVTPLHLACHYDHPNVANMILEKGASPHLPFQNGHTPLHIAARKNQMDIASTLLEHGAEPNAQSKAGFTPLQLSAQKGHYDMTNLLIEHGADPNHKAKNGLTALHLCAQEDSIRVASVLVKNGANVESATESGYRPIHVASHFGNISMIRFLLKHNAQIDVRTKQNYTPLHQAAQQGHAHVVSALLEENASHTAKTTDDLTPLNIAQKLGYISVMEVLKGLSYDSKTPDNKTWEEKYKVIAPESLHETCFMSDSDDEGVSDGLTNEQPYRYLTVDLMKSLRDDSLPIDVTRDDPVHRQLSKEEKQEFTQSSNYCPPENFDSTDGINLGRLTYRSFFVSFLVDARGGTMKGCRYSGIRIIVPPRRATMPIRVTCRLVKLSKVANPPALMEGESLATRIIEMGPVGASFLGPVLIDIPHFASVHGKEREIIILRSENGETWKEHDNSYENDESLFNTAYDTQMSASHCGRIVRIITTEFPQYFAIVTRIKQEVHVIGADGGILISSVANHVQAVFPPGALTKKIKVGLQAHVIPTELTAKLLGNCVAVSPVITIEPRRRKFHKPITLTIPVPQAASKGMINQYEGETPTLRLLCSIAGGTSEAQWEDVTGSTPLTFLNNRVSFTTTVSARFWLMDCRNISEVPKMATELYKESLFVPFITNFVIYTKRFDVIEATLRILCMTGGKDGLHTLEQQEEFLEIVKSRDVEALDGKEIFLEFSGNLVPVTKSGQQLKFTFKAFRQNRLSFHVKVKDPLLDPVARMMFMRDPRVAKGEPAQQPICVLNIVLPEVAVQKSQSRSKLKELDSEFMNKMDLYKTTYMQDYGEKRDMPKLTSSNEQEKIDDIVEKKNKDAAIVESLAKNVACSLESVDASNIDNANDHKDMSPTLEHQTYSEKLRFWEEVSKKRDSYQRSESEISRASQLTINETDSEFAQNIVSEDNDAILNDSETMEELDVPDISECTVAEKAHYFEEQIQKEIETTVKVPFTKTPGGQDSKKGKQNNIVDQTSVLETEGADLKSIKHDKNVESQKLEKKSMVSQIPKKISSPEENKKENEKIKSEQMEEKMIRKKSMDLGEPEVKIIEQKSEVRVETKIPASKIPTKVKTDSTSSKIDNKEITSKSDTVNLIKEEIESKTSGIPIPSSKNNKLELDMSPKDTDDNKKKSKIPVQVLSSTTKVVDNNQGKEAVITVTETKITETISQHYEKQTTETKSQSQTVIKTVTLPKDSFESIEEIKITSEPESTITSKVNLEETKKVAEKEIISSQISKDDTKILKHEERDHESSEKLSESKVTTEKKDETLEDKITRSEKSDKNGVKEILIEVADGKQTISAAASQGMKILKDEIRSERTEDSEKIVVQETEAKMLKEREVDTAITMEKSESQGDEKSDIDTFNLDKSFEDELKAAVVREESREEYSNRSDINVYLPKESTENISREESFAEEIPEELDNYNLNIADKDEVRNIAESLIQSIENEIIKRSESSQGIKLDFDYEKNDTEKEMDSNDFDERLADNLNQKLTSLMKDQGMEDFEQGIIGHDKNSTHQSSSISEDITKEEEEDLSFDKKETEESVLLSSSQVKVLDKDVTISLSSMSDQIELEESLESDKYQLERHLSGLPDEIRVAEEYIEHPQELVMPIKYETSEDSGARVLQILEPGVNIFETAQSFMPEAEDQEYVPDDEEHSLDEKYMKDLEFNKLHESEAMEHLDKLDKICNIEKPVRSRLQSSVSEPSVVREKKEIDHEFFESKRAEKLKVKELEIPHITWSIGDEKIGIVETLEPSEAFDRELDELQSSLNKQKDLISPHEEIIQEDSSKDLEEEIVFSADTAIEDVEGDIEVRLSPDLSDTMIEPEDNKIEAQLVENKLDISCQELVATLQREYETKTPTDEPIPLTPRRMSDSIETLDFPKVDDQTISEPVRELTPESTPSQLDSSKVDDQTISEPVRKPTLESTPSQLDSSKVDDQTISEPVRKPTLESTPSQLDSSKVNDQTISEPVRKPTLESTPSQLDSSKVDDQTISEPVRKPTLESTPSQLDSSKVDDQTISEPVRKPTLESTPSQLDSSKVNDQTISKPVLEPTPSQLDSSKVDDQTISEPVLEPTPESTPSQLDSSKVDDQTISEPVLEPTPESTPGQLDSSKVEDQSIPEPPPSAVDKKIESETVKKEEKVQIEKKETSPLQKSPKKDKKNESFTESIFKSYKESFSHITQSFDDSKRHPEKLVDIKEHLSYGASIDSASMKLKKEDLSNVDLSSKYAITVLDQVVKREIAEVKESLEAAKQDLIEELSEQNQPVQIKDSPSEFQFKLQPESIPNDLPFLYKAPSVEQMTEQEEQYSKLPTDTQKKDDEQDEDSFTDSNVLSSDIKVDIQDVEVSLDTSSAPVPASRSSSDIENKEDGSSSLSIPPQPVPRRRQKPTRISKAIYSEREGESSSGESSNYQSCDYESGSRPSSSDVEALHSAAGILSGTASEYETALMSVEHTTSKPTSQDYQSAVSTLSSHESMKSLNSLSSGHLGSIDSTSELTETLVASESDKEDEINENLDMALEGVDQREKSISPESDVEHDELMVDDNIAGTIPTKMKRSSEMLFQHISDDTESFVVPEGFDGFTEDDSKQQSGKTVSSLIVNRDDDDKTSITDVISDQIAVEESSSSPEIKLNSIEAQLTGDDVSELKMTTLSAEDAEALLLSKRSVLQQASMSTSSTSGMSVETVIERERPDRHSPDSDSFELVDKPDIIDDFVVIEEVGREAKEFDAEGKSISIKTTSHTIIKKFDRDIENLITDKKQEGESSSKPIRTTEVFDFESEESPPQASNEDQYSQQSYSDDETEAKKWMEMQFQADARAYELECERGPLEDIKEEEITDFEAGSSRFGSLGSHKGSIGSSGSMKGSYGSTEFDVLAGKKMFAKSIEHDNISMNSLQEFENLESAVIGADGTRRFQCGSQDSVNNGSLPRRNISGRSGHGDDISVSSLKDFEGLEKACREAHMIELRAKEEEDLLEHESPENRYRLENLTKPKPVEPSTSFNPSTSGSDDYEKRIMEIDEIIRIAQANVEKFDRQDDTTEDISQIDITDTEKVEPAATNLMSTASEIAQITRETNIMETSTDSLELENNTEKQNNLMYKSSDSLELKTTIDLPSLSYSDSLNNVRESQVADKFNSARRISSDSLEAPVLDHPETVQSETTESSSNGSQSNDKITKNGKAASIATTKS